MAEWEEKIFENVNNNHIYDGDIKTFFISEHGEEKLKNFVQTLNDIHPTIKFTAKWSKKSIFFGEGMLQFHWETAKLKQIKPTDCHWYVRSSSCHPYHCEKSSPNSRALRLNQISSKSNCFDIHCNNLEKCLNERGYSQKLICKGILYQSRETLLDKE